MEQKTGTRGTTTRDPESWTGTVAVRTGAGTRLRVPGSQSDGVQLYFSGPRGPAKLGDAGIYVPRTKQAFLQAKKAKCE